MTVIAPATLSTTVIRDSFRDGLLAAAADPADPLQDPKATTRPAKSPFVVTAFPKRDALYPVIVVEEFSDRGAQPDQRVDVHEHRYGVRITIRSDSATNLYKIRDAVRAWIEREKRAFAAVGLWDIEVSSNAATWDSTSELLDWQIIVTSILYTAEVP